MLRLISLMNEKLISNIKLDFEIQFEIKITY